MNTTPLHYYKCCNEILVDQFTKKDPIFKYFLNY